MLKKLLFILLVYPVAIFASGLPNYKAVQTAVQKGQRVNVALDFSKCTPQMFFSAFYSPQTILLDNGSILFSEKHFTLDNPEFPNQPIIEYINYKLEQDGNFKVKTIFLDPTTLKEKGKQPPIVNCVIGKGVLFYSETS